jgi:hypothetical protein
MHTRPNGGAKEADMDKDSRKALKEQARQIKTMMGVYQLRNTVNGKLYVASATNLKNKEFTLRMQLDDGRHMNSALQKEYKEFGGDAFTYEVLEQADAAEAADRDYELRQQEKKWLGQLSPFGEKGYNKEPAKE